MLMSQQPATATTTVGLDGCCDDAATACCCVGACLCPQIAYGFNYAKAIRSPEDVACCCPCLAHGVVDAALPTAMHFACPTATAALSLPLGCCLRVTHRRAVLAAYHPQPNKQRPLWQDALIEFCCWGCSMVQVSRLIDSQPGLRLTSTSSVLGTLSLPVSSIAGTTTDPLLLYPQQDNSLYYPENNNNSSSPIYR